MQEFLQALMNPGSWTRTQWLALGIALLLLVASFYFVMKLYQIIRDAGKSSYRPNIGRSRLQAGQEQGATQESAGEEAPKSE